VEVVQNGMTDMTRSACGGLWLIIRRHTFVPGSHWVVSGFGDVRRILTLPGGGAYPRDIVNGVGIDSLRCWSVAVCKAFRRASDMPSESEVGQCGEPESEPPASPDLPPARLPPRRSPLHRGPARPSPGSSMEGSTSPALSSGDQRAGSDRSLSTRR
jgi:hypothetical protein